MSEITYTDQVLRYLYENLKIYSWQKIAHQINARCQTSFRPLQCRDRYLEIAGPVVKNEWTPEEENQLYSLHNQNGNRWAVIAQHLIGRTDNSVKNHFYSKLRKSLRTLNKIAKLHLKKTVKEVGAQVIYKLTEATDQSLKQNSDFPKEIAALSLELKNRLLQYDKDQKELSSNLNYSSEKTLLTDLLNFNKIYKKKAKKTNQDPNPQKAKVKKTNRKVEKDESFYGSENEESQQNSSLPKNNQGFDQQSQMSLIPKKTINLVLKEPSKEQMQEYDKESIKPTSKVEDILRAQGILENGNYGSVNFFRRDNSSRSFSVCSESPNPDMFGDSQNGLGEHFIFQGALKEYSEVENESQIFKHD